MKGRRACFEAAVAVAVATLFAVSCGGDVVYSRYSDVAIDGWRRGDTMTFVVPPMPQFADCEAFLGMRVSYEYPYSNVALVVEQQSVESGRTLRVDTVECLIAAEVDVLRGKGISLYHHAEPLRLAPELRSDTTRVRVWHAMRRTSLVGIADVGITILRRAER